VVSLPVAVIIIISSISTGIQKFASCIFVWSVPSVAYFLGNIAQALGNLKGDTKEEKGEKEP